ncbi:MAG: hypothetical protein ICV64_12310 [Thermoleophilia bacterium]|nr:hypothetical protein [Thermoleophilia bacterium]
MHERIGRTPGGRLAPERDRFRRANDELGSRYAELSAEGVVPFICECADERCTRVASLTLDEYAAVARTPGRYVILPGHEHDDERVVHRDDRYAVAEWREPERAV